MQQAVPLFVPYSYPRLLLPTLPNNSSLCIPLLFFFLFLSSSHDRTRDSYPTPLNFSTEISFPASPLLTTSSASPYPISFDEHFKVAPPPNAHTSREQLWWLPRLATLGTSGNMYQTDDRVQYQKSYSPFKPVSTSRRYRTLLSKPKKKKKRLSTLKIKKVFHSAPQHR